MNVTSCRKAFTLVELLVVVGIIGILSSVILVSLQESRDKASIATYIAEARSLENVVDLCAEDLGINDCEKLSTGQCSSTLTTNERTIVSSGNSVRTTIRDTYAADCGWRPHGSTGLCGPTVGLVTYAEARDFCSSNGGRLCALEELGLPAGSGCSFDGIQNWTTTTCATSDGTNGIMTTRGSRTTYNVPANQNCVTDLQNATAAISCCSETI